mmetsp:Transcript_23809/g.20744  ORF Transcript_23809/g.20744 Transcript_23809/m.20744 type:complete len:189 (-) Transcript_23809:51-617(-)
MIFLQKAFSPLTVFYFVFLIFLGAFFLLNLTLAVISAKYKQAGDDKAQAAEEDKGLMPVSDYKILKRKKKEEELLDNELDSDMSIEMIDPKFGTKIKTSGTNRSRRTVAETKNGFDDKVNSSANLLRNSEKESYLPNLFMTMETKKFSNEPLALNVSPAKDRNIQYYKTFAIEGSKVLDEPEAENAKD